ncbi:hypothetical protein BDV98DRAFT_546502 [Pterulicium gracile]|uniref:Peptide hydrolase n=1 Tax=Pterulicium gracile TaxID=1884261 RepID=A0A5C3QMI6_9AGAR|nr:hypothetical protein BDV98DRAFT_546502 [Pterula gracilis]
MRAGALLVPALAATVSVSALPNNGPESSRIAGIDLGKIFDPPSWWWLPDLLKPRLSSKAYQKSITIDGLLQHSKALSKFAAINGANTRSFGTPGYNASVEYVERWAKSYGYDVYRQTVVYPASELISNALTVTGSAYPSDALRTFQYSGATPAGGVTADLVAVAGLGCQPAEYNGVEGKIALVVRGNCTFVEKGNLAAEAGAAAIIIWNNAPGGPVSSRLDVNTLLTNPPTIGISQEDGQALADRLAAGETLETLIEVNVRNEIRPADNVIAQSKWGDKNNVIFVGAHLDSVPAGPGINDDGSGTAAVAELLKQMARYKKSKNAVRFAWWATEEVGLVGSRYYVENLSQEERDKIVLYVNMDMVASPNYILGVYDSDNSGGANTGIPSPPGSNTLEAAFQQHFVEAKLNHTAYAFTAGSDYRPFLDAGIVAGGVATGAGGIKTEREVGLFGGEAGIPYDVCYHQACDTIDNLAHDAFVWITRSVADIFSKYVVDASPIKNEKKLAARGLPLPRGPADIVSHLGKECSHHDEL